MNCFSRRRFTCVRLVLTVPRTVTFHYVIKTIKSIELCCSRRRAPLGFFNAIKDDGKPLRLQYVHNRHWSHLVTKLKLCVRFLEQQNLTWNEAFRFFKIVVQAFEKY